MLYVTKKNAYLYHMDISIQIINADEGAFFQALLNHERWAQKQLYEEQYPSMMAIAIRYANNHDDALDILHESFIKIFNNIHKYQINTSLSSWTKRILINTAIDYYWKEIRRKTENLENAFHLKSDVTDPISNLTTEEIINTIQHLTPSCRSIFNLYVIEGYSHKEIAKMLRIKESTCRANLVKARMKLKEMLLVSDKNIR